MRVARRLMAKRFRLVLGTLVWCDVAYAEAPFRPAQHVPDYVATYVDRVRGKPATSTITHHGGWTRIDRSNDGEPRMSEYYGPGHLRLRTSRGASISLLSIERGAEDAWGWDVKPIKTGHIGALLGEQCDVWDVARTFNARNALVQLRRLSCVTSDGIELWSRLEGGVFTDSHEVAMLRRQPIPPKDVYPPAELLTLEYWLGGSTGRPQHEAPPPDVMVVLRNGPSDSRQENQNPTKTVRRHHPWVHEEVTRAGRRELIFKRDYDNLEITVHTDTANRPFRLNISRHDVHKVGATAGLMDLNSSETVLGEKCNWFRISSRIMAHVAQGFLCLTADGVALMETSGTSGADQSWTAVEISRIPLRREAVLPPADILGPIIWGIPVIAR